MTQPAPLPEEDDILAAELAFGLLDAPERHAAEARAAGDPGFAVAHRRWQVRAVALLAGPDVAPRPSVWTGIAARLPANDTAPAADPRLRWWQAGTLAASAAAVVLAVVAVERTPVPLAPPPVVRPATAPPPMVAVLTGDKGVVAVSFDPASARITAAPAGMAIGRHAAELWVIPADGKPRSLGVIAADRTGATSAPAPALPAMAPGVTLAVSVEPIGGSPTGQPTGPVILTGKIAAT